MGITPVILLVAALFNAACSDEKYSEVSNIEENENLIEPKLDPWQLFSKPKGKSTLKNLILSFYKYDTQRKFMPNDQKSIFSHPVTLSATTPKKETTTTTAPETSSKPDGLVMVMKKLAKSNTQPTMSCKSLNTHSLLELFH